MFFMSMPTRYRILERLRENPGAVVSGGELAAELGVSRTAVWKQIAALQQEGYQNILKYGVAFYRKECMVKKAK